MVWAPMSGSVAMSVSILSYNGRVSVGVMSDAGLVPDPERIARGFERELRKLRRLFPPDEKASGAPKPVRRTRAEAAPAARAAISNPARAPRGGYA